MLSSTPSVRVDGEAFACSGLHFSYLVKSYSRHRFFHPSRRLVIFGSDILCFRSRSRRRTKSGASRRGDVTFRVPPGAAVFSRSLRRRADVLPLRAPHPQNAACNCVVLAGLFRLVFKSSSSRVFRIPFEPHACSMFVSFVLRARVLCTPNQSHELNARSETIADVRPTSCVESYRVSSHPCHP